MSVLYVGSSEISPILDVTQNQKTFNILEYKQSDHILNDIRWLRANTNSWQSGEMYESAYAALVEYKRTATLKSHTINDITVPYYLAENGFKIVLAEQAENVDNLYNTQGFADYFILDVDNKQFKLPRRSNRRIIKSQKASKDNNYSWYNIYSDGWVEQGGKVLTVEDSAVDVVFPVEMVDANQYLFHGNVTHELALNTASLYLKTITHSATGVSVVGVANMGATTIYQAMEFEWEVLGAAAESEYVDLDDVLYDYYYVGEFEQTALMQTAGVVSEQLNGLDKYIDDKVAESMSSAAGLPEQEGNAGKFLTTDGTNASWAEIQQGSGSESEITAAGAPLLTSIWSDHLLKDASWRRADDFEWHDGRIYTAAYEHLAGEIESTQKKYYAWSGMEIMLTFYTEREVPLAGDIVYTTGITEDEWTEYGTLVSDYDGSGYLYISSGDLDVARSESKDIVRAPGFLSDTIGDITITYYLAEDGHKICQPDQESNLATLYETTGAAWYYLIDPINERFKLPRTKWGFTGLRDSVGGYVEAGLPNITGITNTNRSTHSYSDGGAFYDTGIAHSWYGDNIHSNVNNLGFDASLSNSIYGNSDTVQPPATQMYLYFYVGNFKQQTEEEINDLLDTVEEINDLLDTVAYQAMPSDRYVDMLSILPAAGGNITAPADGYFVMHKVITSGQHLELMNTTTNLGSTAHFYSASGNIVGCVFVPVKVGDVIEIWYNSTPTTFRFIYANGSK